MLTPEGKLKSDPRRTDWRSTFARNEAAQAAVKASNDSLVADRSALSEVLNVAWAMHELVGDHISESLAWLESGGRDAEVLNVND